MLIAVSFSIMISVILAMASWNRRMSPYHGPARLGFFISGVLCIGGMAESEGPAIMFLLILTMIGCFFMLYKMLTQV
jgi:hypothetical protein